MIIRAITHNTNNIKIIIIIERMLI